MSDGRTGDAVTWLTHRMLCGCHEGDLRYDGGAAEEWDRLPDDLGDNVDRYLYGATTRLPGSARF